MGCTVPRNGRKLISRSTASLVNVHCLQQCRQVCCSEVPSQNSQGRTAPWGRVNESRGWLQCRGGTAHPNKGAVPLHLSRMGHSRISPKWGDSPGPLSPQGSQSGGAGDVARGEEKRKGGRAEDKITGMKSIHETVPDTQKRIRTTTSVTDKVELTAHSGSGVYLRGKKNRALTLIDDYTFTHFPCRAAFTRIYVVYVQVVLSPIPSLTKGFRMCYFGLVQLLPKLMTSPYQLQLAGSCLRIQKFSFRQPSTASYLQPVSISTAQFRTEGPSLSLNGVLRPICRACVGGGLKWGSSKQFRPISALMALHSWTA